MIVNVPFILMNCIDMGLYRFTGKRSGSEIFSILSFGNDFVNTAPKMIVDFWYLFIIFIILVVMLLVKYPRLIFKDFNNNSKQPTLQKFVFFIMFLGLVLVGFRGGIQYRPLNILSASRYGAGKTAELVLNTSFTIIKTFGKATLDDLNWLPKGIAENYNPVIKTPDHSVDFKEMNVVVIILEGIGKEYIGSLNNYQGYTPFLDSLIGKSLVFSNAYANGKRSIEGIPSIVAGIPALMHDPFITSAYSGNSVTSIASLLKNKGYYSEFFHGGTNGTMGFDNFSRLAGYDRYFGRSEYNNDDDFDGSWGIYDEPFLQKTANEIEKMKEPFFATVFTLSSHHPYKIPEKFAGQFPKGTLPIHSSIGYADYSLKKFFETASKMKWFDNTVFVITADHTALSEYPFYRNHVGLFSIPIIFYIPSDTTARGINQKTTQQIDVLPGLMDYLNYDKPYFAFGESMFGKSDNGYAIQFIDDSYQLIAGDHLFVLDTLRKNSFYNFVSDSLLIHDISGADSAREDKMKYKLQAVVQQFNKAVIHNEMKTTP